LATLPQNRDPNLLVGFGTSDDAGVYRLDDEKALVMTADFITPPVDDPYLFGQIAAANALSDVYAMGGRPLACLNLVAFPDKQLGPEVLQGIVAGALSKIVEAGAVLSDLISGDRAARYSSAAASVIRRIFPAIDAAALFAGGICEGNRHVRAHELGKFQPVVGCTNHPDDARAR